MRVRVCVLKIHNEQTLGSSWACCIRLFLALTLPPIIIQLFIPILNSLSVMGRGDMCENPQNSPVHCVDCMTVLVQSHSATTTYVISDKQFILKTLPQI